MLATFSALAPIFLLIVIGYILFHTKLAGPDVWWAVEHLTFYLLFPALIARTLIRADLGSVPAASFMIVTLSAVVGMAALLLALRPLFARHGLTGPTFTSLFQGATRWHGVMATAIAGSLYGAEGLTFAALAIVTMVPVIQVMTVLVLLIYGRDQGQPTPKLILQRLATNPLIIACAVGFALNQTDVPDLIYETFTLLGQGSIGLTLLAVGAGLSLSNATETRALVATGVLVRLIGMPLIILGMSWLVGLDGLARTIAVIAGAVPTASTSYVMARKMGGNAQLMANIITFQSIAAAFSLPLFITIAESL
jgi:predicted permease